MIAWMVYAVVVSAMLAVAGHLAEDNGIAGPTRRRWIWVGVLLGSILIPFLSSPEPTVLPEALTVTPVATAALPPAPTPVIDWNLVALTLWGGLSAGWILVAGFTLLAVSTARRSWLPERLLGLSVLLSKSFGPAVVGVRKPEIVLPTWVAGLDDEDLKVVLLHEEEHRRAHDHLTLLLGAFLAAILAWNPVAWWALKRLRHAVELDCDQRVLEDGVPVARYGRVLVDVGAGRSGSWGLVPGMAQSKSTLERRLKTMRNARTRSRKQFWVGVLGGTALMLAACETPAPTGVRNALDQALATRAAAQEITPVDESYSDDAGPAGVLRYATGQDPVVYVDGVRFEGDIRSIDVDDIDRIEVIKGEVALARFGDEGRHGVIQIFTKEYEVSVREREGWRELEVERLREVEERVSSERALREVEERASAERALQERQRGYEDAAREYERRRAVRAVEEIAEESARDVRRDQVMMEEAERRALEETRQNVYIERAEQIEQARKAALERQLTEAEAVEQEYELRVLERRAAELRALEESRVQQDRERARDMRLNPLLQERRNLEETMTRLELELVALRQSGTPIEIERLERTMTEVTSRLRVLAEELKKIPF